MRVKGKSLSDMKRNKIQVTKQGIEAQVLKTEKQRENYKP